jgi:hypothetical protein
VSERSLLIERLITEDGFGKRRRKPKMKHKRQSKRFKEAARKIAADQPSDAIDRIVK